MPVKNKVHLFPKTLAEIVQFFSFDSSIVVVALAEPKVDLGMISVLIRKIMMMISVYCISARQ